MDKKKIFGVLFVAAGTLVSQEILSSSKIDIILNSQHANYHLPEGEKPHYENTTKTSILVTASTTAGITTSTTAP
jgi:hypothetical protein